VAQRGFKQRILAHSYKTMAERKTDIWLIRIKDLFLIVGALWTLLIWGMGFINLPVRVQKTEEQIVLLTSQANAADKANELFHKGIGKDIEFIRISLSELKTFIGIKSKRDPM